METASTERVLEIRRLNSSEYDELLKIEEGYRPEPEHSVVVVAKQDGAIVARTMLIRPFHIEGTWIDERFRKGTLGLRLMMRLEKEAKDAGLTKLFSYAADADIESYLERLGYTKQPVTVWTKDI
ncbi:MAG TPA: GNAT family N-acetyltransferase [Candidatus Sulfotelmatobacter sp.]|nr:GNAT family N-acetyltransferase [Candidatus Sulfotelmatobacter sp.]